MSTPEAQPIEVDIRMLGPLRKIGSGGQGTVYELVNGPEHLVYKQYSERVANNVDVTALKKFVQFLRELDDKTADELTSRAAWPVNVVRKDGVVNGFVMPRAPADYSVEMQWTNNKRSAVLGQVQFLLNDENYLQQRDLEVSDHFRLQFLRDTARTLMLFHKLGITVGDLSPNNLLFTRTDPPRCFFIDCDAMRLGGDTILEQVETAEWRVAELGDEELATPQSDSYKLGLLTIRLFAGDQHSRDPDMVPRRLRRLVIRCLDEDPTKRPTVREWEGPIVGLLRPSRNRPQNRGPRRKPQAPPKNSARPEAEPRPEPETATPPSAPPPPRPVFQPVTRPRRRSGAFGAAMTGIGALIAIIIGMSSGSDSGSGTAAQNAGAPLSTLGANPYPNPTARYTPGGLPNYTPYVPPAISYPRFTMPSLIRPLDICLKTIVMYRTGVARNQKVTDALGDTCAVERSTLEVTAIAKAGANLRVTARYKNSETKKCLRRIYTLVPEGEGFSISTTTDPVATTGCAF